MAANLGITLTNNLFASDPDGRVLIKRLEPRTTVEMGIALPSGAALSPAVRAFADFAIPILRNEFAPGNES